MATWDVPEVPVGDTSVVCFNYTLDGTLCEVCVRCPVRVRVRRPRLPRGRRRTLLIWPRGPRGHGATRTGRRARGIAPACYCLGLVRAWSAANRRQCATVARVRSKQGCGSKQGGSADEPSRQGRDMQNRAPLEPQSCTCARMAAGGRLHEAVTVTDASGVCRVLLSPLARQELVKRVPAHIYCLIADENVFALYGEQFLAKFKATGKTLFHMVLPSGETTKDRRVKEEVEDFMLRNKMNRDTCCIALGGGVIGDLTGYIAATFMRGVPFVQVPTTLLAMVDASVGGKTAVNTSYGKNLIGSFHQPTVVFMDMGFLDGFSKRDPVRAEREFKAGIAEIIKTGAIWDASLFEVCEQKVESIQRRERAVLNEIVRRSVAIKAEVVTLDPKEGGLRAILNWGHTIGHAVEGLMGMTDYADGLLHGECVAIGMVLECNLARAMGVLHSSAVGRVVRCIEAYKLPTKIPHHLRIDDIMKKMMGDKKNTGGKLKCVIIDKIGHCWEPKASMVCVRAPAPPCAVVVLRESERQRGRERRGGGGEREREREERLPAFVRALCEAAQQCKQALSCARASAESRPACCVCGTCTAA